MHNNLEEEFKHYLGDDEEIVWTGTAEKSDFSTTTSMAVLIYGIQLVLVYFISTLIMNSISFKIFKHEAFNYRFVIDLIGIGITIIVYILVKKQKINYFMQKSISPASMGNTIYAISNKRFMMRVKSNPIFFNSVDFNKIKNIEFKEHNDNLFSLILLGDDKLKIQHNKMTSTKNYIGILQGIKDGRTAYQLLNARISTNV